MPVVNTAATWANFQLQAWKTKKTNLNKFLHIFVKKKYFSDILGWLLTHLLAPSLKNEKILPWQGFIQAILMPVRRHKKLNLLIEFSNSIFIKFYFIAFQHKSFVQNTFLSFRYKKAKIFHELYPTNPHQVSAINLLHSFQHLETFTCILQHSKTQS